MSIGEDRILVGLIISPHGIDGLLSVECLSDNPTRFAPGAVLQTAQGQALTVTRATPHKGRLLVGFAGVTDRDQAEKLRKTELYITPGQVESLPAGVYYHFQIIGLQVWQQEKLLGQVADILCYSANDVYVVDKVGGGQLLLPALKAVIKNIDINRGVMEVQVPEGLE